MLLRTCPGVRETDNAQLGAGAARGVGGLRRAPQVVRQLSLAGGGHQGGGPPGHRAGPVGAVPCGLNAGAARGGSGQRRAQRALGARLCADAFEFALLGHCEWPGWACWAASRPAWCRLSCTRAAALLGGRAAQACGRQAGGRTIDEERAQGRLERCGLLVDGAMGCRGGKWAPGNVELAKGFKRLHGAADRRAPAPPHASRRAQSTSRSAISMMGGAASGADGGGARLCARCKNAVLV